MAWGQQRRGVDDLVAKLRANETGPALLVMSMRKVDESGLCALADALAENSSLEELLCSGHSVSEDAAKRLGQALRQNSTLKRLSVGCAQFGDAELAALLDAWENSTLEALDLEFKSLTAGGMPHLGSVLAQPSHALQDLRLGRNDLGDGGVAALAQGLRNGPLFLRNLELNSSGLGVEGCRALGKALRGSSAAQGSLRLILSDNPAIGDAGARALVGDEAAEDKDDAQHSASSASSSEVSSLSSVCELHVDACGLGAEGFASIIAASDRVGSCFHALRILAVGRNEIKEVSSVTASICATQLDGLDLRANKMGLSGLAAFGAALSKSSQTDSDAAPRLQRLNLTSIGVSVVEDPTGAGNEDFRAAVGDLLQGVSLKELRLMGNALGNDGVAILADLLRENATLETLGIGGVGLTREGAEALKTPLQENSTLRTLELGGNDLGDGKTLVDDFRAARPDLVVALDGQQQP
ncbi:NACHT, LRR and PYD domains-containing protein 3 [Hondaea fermentalgiana]|uniref:NACHT, LRR and PYD domains-containing protein 3 n=1 Tax=Hondaea fermentalgiana TaxID=2315210 RepID=A0A2R5GZM4_9STRA|nr:NACHT, LRR and PYD domains-containing protein 3 [Hondaea fermentalgiana]|eukprot:GBG34223.1 NACHT, LRR and PYD domains-containing protein 3 [Hondaea fermentalgiana]